MKKYLVLILLIVCTISTAQSKKNFEAKIDSIIALMTVEEKAGQLNQLSSGLGWGPVIQADDLNRQKQLVREGKIGSFLNAIGANLTRDFQKVAVEESRLKIPLIFGLDVIHGFKTTFPVPLAEAASWDASAAELSARIAAKEASAFGINWTFAPMVDIARDPRWGRIVEGAGEDPFLGSIIAAARVRGFQGDLSSKENIAACVKHFAAYGAAEGGRDYNTVDMSEQTLRDIYLPPYKAALDAGARTFMCSFNEINGQPSSSNHKLLTDILRGEWKFDGFVVSDWNSVGELIAHGVASDLKHAGELGLNAGVDMDMEARSYVAFVPELIKENKVSMQVLDEAVRRILRVKFEMGLFDNPYRNCNPELEKTQVLTAENRKAALDVARKSIVLLKNENNVLPLKKNVKTIAVIGPLADDKQVPLGSWEAQGRPENVITVLQGLKNKLGNNVKILTSMGAQIDDNTRKGFDDAVQKAKQADIVIMAIGEAGSMSGEARSRSSLELPGVQLELVKEIQKTGKPVVVLLMNGRPLAVPWISENIPAIVETWFLGSECGNAIADVLFGDYNPSGKLPVTFPRVTGQIPIHYNHKNTGRPGDTANHYTSKYIDLPLTPLYPFGFGLSYTTFEYSKPSISSASLRPGETLKITVDVKNTGNYDGEEVVQLYIRDLVGSITRPVKELKGFSKQLIRKGETKTFGFTLSEKDLAFHNADLKFAAEPGKFKAYIGTNSRDVQELDFELLK